MIDDASTIASAEAPLEVGRPAPALTFTDDLDFTALPFASFAAAVVAEGYPHTAAWRWLSDEATVEPLVPYAVATSRGTRAQAVMLDLELELGGSALGYVWLRDNVVFARGATRRLELLAEIEAWLRARVPEATPSDDVRLPVTFWGDGCRYSRTIDVARWEDVSRNYPRDVARLLHPMMKAAFRPADTGRLVLWHGLPGTGKTSALRALGWAWRAWCDVHFVTDPERLFGEPGYLLEVLLGDDEADGDRWRLLVLEDTGELLTADAKERSGQGLSRLLNVVDGLVGQGLRLLVLVTTNEQVRSLHEAVTRPGRCASLIHFSAFAADEADAWLTWHGHATCGASCTLAELFAVAAGEAPPARRGAIGFVDGG
jgi:hypothetical protein